MPISLSNCNLESMQKLLCEGALEQAKSLVGAAELMGIDQKELSRVITKHRIHWPRETVIPVYHIRQRGQG